MKRLVKKSKNNYTLQVGDNVKWKRHPYDDSIYEVHEILPDGTIFMDNGIQSYTNIKPSVVEKINLVGI